MPFLSFLPPKPHLKTWTPWLGLACGLWGIGVGLMQPAVSHATEPPVTAPGDSAANPDLDLPPGVLEQSPVLQRWLQDIPDVEADIRHDPSFRTRLRLGYSHFPAANQSGGWHAGVEDVFVGRTGLTVSGDYHATFNGQSTSWGGDLRYYVRPLGSYVNVAPVVGYRRLQTELYTTEGANVGVRLLLVPSRGGAADLSLTQTWVAPGTDQEVGLTTFSVGYAITQSLRFSTDIQQQNARQRQDSRVGIGLEWML